MRVRILEWSFLWLLAVAFAIASAIWVIHAPVLWTLGTVGLLVGSSFRLSGAVLTAWSDREYLRRQRRFAADKQAQSGEVEP